MTTPSPEGDTPPMASQADSGDASKASQADSEAKANAQGMTLEQAQAIINDLRREATKTRAQLSDFEKKQQEADEAKLSELEKANKRAADAEARATAQRDRITQQAVEAAALKLGISDPEYAAYKIRSQLKVDGEGTPENADALLQQFLKDNPSFAAASSTRPPANSGGATNPSRASTAPGATLSWDIIGKMTPAEYEARQGEIQAWMARNPPQRFSR